MEAMTTRQPNPDPEKISPQAWKNRTLISCKLSDEMFHKFYAYCKERDLSFNSALRLIVSDFFSNQP